MPADSSACSGCCPRPQPKLWVLGSPRAPTEPGCAKFVKDWAVSMSFLHNLRGQVRFWDMRPAQREWCVPLCFPFGDGVPPHCLQRCLPWVRRNSPVSTCCCGRPQPSSQGGQEKLERPQDPSVSMLEQPLGMHRGCHRLHIHSPARWGTPLWGAGVTFGVCPLPSWQHRHRHLSPKKTAVDPKSSLRP